MILHCAPRYLYLISSMEYTLLDNRFWSMHYLLALHQNHGLEFGCSWFRWKYSIAFNLFSALHYICLFFSTSKELCESFLANICYCITYFRSSWVTYNITVIFLLYLTVITEVSAILTLLICYKNNRII